LGSKKNSTGRLAAPGQKSVSVAASFECERGRLATYFREVATEVNVVDKAVPTDVIATIMTTEISAAISPYSIAVAPSSFLKNFTSVRIEIAPRETIGSTMMPPTSEARAKRVEII
jgi:hypothetical protein